MVNEDSGRWLAMAVMFFFASVALTLGLPAILTLFDRRGRRLGLAAVGVFTVGTIGTCGYAMLMVFFRALVEIGAVRARGARSRSPRTPAWRCSCTLDRRLLRRRRC